MTGLKLGLYFTVGSSLPRCTRESWLRVAHKYTHLHLLLRTTALPASVLVHMDKDDVEVDIKRANNTTKLLLQIRVLLRGRRLLRKKTVRLFGASVNSG